MASSKDELPNARTFAKQPSRRCRAGETHDSVDVLRNERARRRLPVNIAIHVLGSPKNSVINLPD